MMDRRRGLQVTLVVAGLASLLLYPLMRLWPSGWAWSPGQQEYELMLVGIYATLGVFLLIAARRPEDHTSLIWFAVWSSVVHGSVMALLVLFDPTEHGHLVADIPALFLIAGVLAALQRAASQAPGSAEVRSS
jgi:FtsH-binding integral membrane protein